MINNKRVLALIPARGGSKGIPHKNIVSLADKPLIAYTIEAGIGSKYIDNCTVSTDDNDIAKVSKYYGANVPFMRPDYLGLDSSKTIDAIVHAIEYYSSINDKYDILVLLQPTSPLRTSKHIDEAIEEFVNKERSSLVSISEVNDNPVLIRSFEGKNGKLIPLINENSTVRRQDMRKYYRINGAIYINNISDINRDTSFNDNEYGYVMDQENSIDIDTLADLEEAERLLWKIK